MGNEDINQVDKLHKQIAALHLQLEAQIARSSHLQSRLSSALDTVETLSVTHARELSDECEINRVLDRKLDALVEYTQKIEEDRDELRDAVLALVERVESSNDYSVWPYARIRLPDILEPIKPSSGDGMSTSPAAAGPPTKTQEYAPLVIAALRAELERERASHARTHDCAELEILCLRAQLAQRDAQLQACVAHTDHAALLRQTSKRRTPAPLTPEEVVRMLDIADVGNREREAEVQRLVSRLEKSRGQTRSPTPRAHKNSHPTRHTEQRRHSPALAIPNPMDQPTTSPSSPSLSPHVRHDIPSPYTMTPRIPGTPRKTQAGAGIPEEIDEHVNLEHLTRNAVITDFGEEIKKLSHEIDMLREERHEWKEVLLTDSEATITVGRVVSEPVEEGTKIPQGETSIDQLTVLRAEFEEFKQAAARREAEFEAEITKLRQASAERQPAPSSGETDTLVALAESRPPLPLPISSLEPPDGDTAAHVDVPWDENDAEQSMDLATPLQPTVVLADGDTIIMTNAPPTESPSAPAGVAIPVDPLLIPLPESPIGSSRALTPPLASPSPEGARFSALQHRPPTPFSFAPTPAQSVQRDEHDDEENRQAAHDMPGSPTEQAGSFDAANVGVQVQVLEQCLQEARQAVADRDAEIAKLERIVDGLRAGMGDAALQGSADEEL